MKYLLRLINWFKSLFRKQVPPVVTPTVEPTTEVFPRTIGMVYVGRRMNEKLVSTHHNRNSHNRRIPTAEVSGLLCLNRHK